MRGLYGYGTPGTGGFGNFMGYAAAGGFPWISVITWIIGIAVVAAIIVLIVRLSKSPRKGHDEALEILAARFARNEISADEYIAAKEFLTKN